MVLFADVFGISDKAVGTSSTYLLSVVGFIILWDMIRPANRYRFFVFSISLLFLVASAWFVPSLFSISGVSVKAGALCAVFAIAEVTVMRWITNIIGRISMYRVVKVKKVAE